MELRRALYILAPNSYRVDLASSLRTLGVSHGNDDRSDEVVVTFYDAVQLYCAEYESPPIEIHRDDLAASQHSLGKSLDKDDHLAEAGVVFCDALQLCCESCNPVQDIHRSKPASYLGISVDHHVRPSVRPRWPSPSTSLLSCAASL